jgi:hypothetical protein
MKRFLIFLAVFLVVLTLGYLEPAFFPAEKPKINNQGTNQSFSHQAMPHEEVKTEGYAAYIGEKITAFTKEYGEPEKKITTGLNYEVWLFGKTDKQYLEVNVSAERITSIKVFNKNQATTPFKMGMQLSDLSALMTIYSDFSFLYQEASYTIELSEEDMNYRPLVAFDNGSFAILFFAAGSGDLLGIDYLDKSTLLSVMPYQLNEGTLLPIEATDQSTSFDAERSKQTAHIINLLKINETGSAFSSNSSTQRSAQQLYSFFDKNAHLVLSSEREATLLETKENQTADKTFTLTKDEFSQLIKQTKLSLDDPEGIYQVPIYDSSFTALIWFSDPTNYARLTQDKPEALGVAFSKENMLVLIQNSKEKTQMTEDSEGK